MFDFRGKVVLITGAAQGFGRVCTVAFAEQGARLAICDINDQGGEETLRQVHEQGADGLYIHADVSKESDVTGLIERTVAAYGRLDIAVNNAAKEIAGPTLDLPSSSFEELVDTNLKGTYYCMKHEVAQMRRNGGGAIVNQASITSSITGVPDNGLYGATKAGIIGLTKSAALQVAAENISINALATAGFDIPNDVFLRWLESHHIPKDQAAAWFPIGRTRPARRDRRGGHVPGFGRSPLRRRRSPRRRWGLYRAVGPGAQERLSGEVAARLLPGTRSAPTPAARAPPGRRRSALVPDLQEPAEPLGRGRFAQKKALHLVAAVLTQERQLQLGLDPFGDHRLAQALGQRDHREDDRLVLGVAADVLHEGPVDLDLGYRQPFEVGERAVAGPEVVDRKAHAAMGQAAHAGADRAVRGLHEQAFGDLELQERRRQAMPAEDLVDRGQEIVAAHLGRRQVDRDPQRMAGLRPGAGLSAGGVEDPAAERSNQPRGLRYRNELAGRDRATVRMPPAHQRFGAHDPIGARVELRLIHDAELLALERVAQVPLQAAAKHHLAMHRPVEEAPAAATLLLGPMQRQIRVAEQPIMAVAVLGDESDPDAGGQVNLLVPDQERRGDRLDDLLREHRRTVRSRAGRSG